MLLSQRDDGFHAGGFYVLRAIMIVKAVAKQLFVSNPMRNPWTILICTLPWKCRNEHLANGHHYAIIFGHL